jgi:hypothetical protein
MIEEDKLIVKVVLTGGTSSLVPPVDGITPPDVSFDGITPPDAPSGTSHA